MASMASPPRPPQPTIVSFKVPYAPASAAGASASSSTGTIKQRRVSLAVPSSARLVPAWNFRDDTTVDKHVPESPTTRLTGHTQASGDDEDTKPPPGTLNPSPEKKVRKKWTMEETKMLVEGCNIYGVGNWKAMLKDPNLKFDQRSAVDLKDRFRTYFPDAYRQHYPNAKTHLSTKIRSTLPDGSSLFEKTRSKKRRPFTEDEDRALKAGYERHGTVWATIVKDPAFRAQNRKSTDLRDRFRNAFPDLYQAAGYKPRNSAKKKSTLPMQPIRSATDDQAVGRRAAGPVRRRRALTNEGYLRGGTKSVPESTTNSDDEDSSGGEDEDEFSNLVTMDGDEPLPSSCQDPMPSSSTTKEVDMDTSIDTAGDDFLNQSSLTEHSLWAAAVETPVHPHPWSAAATIASPTSSHISGSDYFPHQSPLPRRQDGMGTIGKSAWGTQDWLSANPRLGLDGSGASSSSSSYAGGFSPVPSSPFSFHSLSHGVFDRYDLPSFAHDYTSEIGPGDTHSTFSDPEMFSPTSFRGFTHHSNYAGDLIFGARTHQPLHAGSGYGFGFGTQAQAGQSGLGLSGISQPTGVHPMHLHSGSHTPALAGIDEIELSAISLNDPPDTIGDGPEMLLAGDLHRSRERSVQTSSLSLPDEMNFGLSPPDSIDAIIAMTLTQEPADEMHATPPGTPVRTSRRPLRADESAMQSRSMSVPPFDQRAVLSGPMLAQRPPLTPTKSMSILDTFMGAPYADEPALDSSTSTAPAQAPFAIPFLDLHYNYLAHGPTNLAQASQTVDANAGRVGQAQALDLARQPTARQTPQKMHDSGAVGMPTSMPPSAFTFTGAGHPTVPHGRPPYQHHRVQSAVAPQDLLMRHTSEQQRKRASWDGRQ